MKKGNISTGWIIALVLVVIVGGYFLLAGDNADTPNNSEVTEDDPAAMEDQSTSTEDSSTVNGETVVTYTDNGFTPNTVTVNSGDSVKFVNESSNSMWIASAVHPTHAAYDGTSLDDHCEDGVSSSFDSCDQIPSGEDWNFTFNQEGEWNYHDHTNAGNTGTIIVE